jgi:hypothetical protein
MRDVPEPSTLLSDAPVPAEIVGGALPDIGAHWTMPLGMNDAFMLLS